MAKSTNSYVEVGEGGILARMGWFQLRVRSADIGRIEKEQLPWYFFSGWTSLWAAGCIVFGAPGEVVCVEMRQPVWRLAGFVPMSVHGVYLGAEDVGGLMAAIERTKGHSKEVNRSRA